MWEQLIEELERIAKLNDRRLAVRLSPVLDGKAWCTLYQGDDCLCRCSGITLDIAMEEVFEGLEQHIKDSGYLEFD